MKRYGGVTGVINLSEKDGALYKRTLICHTGIFDAMLGPIEITKEKLDRTAKRYNKQHVSVQNDADYAPVLVDHVRQADLIKGRVMPDLTVDKWTDLEDGTEGWGLYGTLRIDDEDAKNKVEGTNGESKKYAQVSMSFDDEATYELFEVSFVAVEAARRAIVLSNGGKNMDLAQQLAALQKKHSTLASRIKAGKAVRGAASLAATENLAVAETEATSLGQKIFDLVTKIKTSALSSQLKNFIREGKLNKAEFDKLNVTELATLPAAALKAVLSSYEARPVSADVIQHGQTGAKPMSVASLSAEETRAMLKAQKAGKGKATLAEGDGDPKPAPAGDKPKDKSDSDSGMKFEDMEDAIKHCESLGEVVEKIKGSMKKLSEQVKKMSEPDGAKEGEDEGAE